MSDQSTPFSQEAEEAVLGAVISNPAAYIPVAAALNEQDFFLLRHQRIWKAINRIADRGEAFDYVTVHDELKALGQIDGIGGAAYLLRLVNNTPSSVHAMTYAKIVKRASTRRRMLIVADEIKALALNEELSLETATEEAETKLLSVMSGTQEKRTVHISDAVNRVVDHVEAAMAGDKTLMGIPTGFKDVDNMLQGMKRGNLIYVAGRPGMGKSAFLTSMARNVAGTYGKRVLIWTGEMIDEELATRVISSEAAINSQFMMAGEMEQPEYNRFTEAYGRVAELPIWIDDTPKITPAKLRSIAIRETALHGVDLLFVDYIGLASLPGYEHNRVQEVGGLSRALKALATELNIPVVVAAQLSRECEKRQDKRPVLSDLRDSGDLEQDGNVVIFLYRDEIYNAATEFPGIAEVIIAKHRGGATGTVMMRFEREITKYVDVDTVTVDLKGGAA